MLNRLKLLQKFITSKYQPRIQWKQKDNLIQFLIFHHKNSRGIKFLIPNDITFEDLIKRQIFQSFQIKFPKDFDLNKKVSHTLTIEETPIIIEYKIQENIGYIRNRAAKPELIAISRGFAYRKGIYKDLELENMDTAQYRSILAMFYLKLQAEAYCKINNISLKSQFTPTIRQEIISYLNYKNQTNEQQKIIFFQNDLRNIQENIQKTQSQIKLIFHKADRLLRIYKIQAVIFTQIHLFSFAYMIFFVDWLGWDIIQPLTFSVSSLYFLIAIRFYRKFNKDRNEDSIRERFRKLVIKPNVLMDLQALNDKLNRQKQQRKFLQISLQISKNRLHQTTTLIKSICP